MQLGTAGDLGDGACQQLCVVASRVTAARSEFLRVAKLVLFDSGRRFQQDEVRVGDRWQHGERDDQRE